MYNISPISKMLLFRINVKFCHAFDTFELLFRVSGKSLSEHLGGTALQKNRSYEYRHQSDAVCHNIFDSFKHDWRRQPLNIPQIDEVTPYHQASGSSIVEHLVRKGKSAVPCEEATTPPAQLWSPQKPSVCKVPCCLRLDFAFATNWNWSEPFLRLVPTCWDDGLVVLKKTK